MKNKLIVLVSILTLLASISVMASSVRMKGLGMSNGEYWMLQKDTAFMTGYNPATVVLFPELLAATDESGLVIVSPMENVKVLFTTGLGIDANTGFKEKYDSNDDGDYVDAGEFDYSSNAAIANEMFAVRVGYKMGDIAIGAKLGYSFADDTDDTTGAKHDYSRYVIQFQPGVFMPLGNGMSIDGVLGLYLGSISQSENGADTYTSSPLIVDLFGRFNMKMSDVSNMHVILKVKSDDDSSEIGTTEVDHKTMTYTLGISDELKLTKTSLVYFGGYYNYIAETAKLEGSGEVSIGASNLRLTLGAEAKLTDNLTGRIGASRELYTNATTEDTDVTDTNDATNATIGFSYKLGKMKMEWNANWAVFKDGPNAVSGTNNDFSTDIIAIYVFETAGAAPAADKK